ncbi:hypothetical protein [Alkalimarinus coralli]|uniref:hypothetical protein n=1 Tax=Alkalimarinus coralli TaxID=2935863 RepID=UPI00202B9174|nr:hypothetical protein [Alkalimarinus coralli]
MAYLSKFSLLLLILISSCAISAGQKGLVQGIAFSVEQKGGVCILSALTPTGEKREYDLGIGSKCFFLTEKSGEIRREYYKDVSSHVFIVAGGSLEKESMNYPVEFASEDECGMLSKGVLVKESGEISVSTHVDRSTIYCPNSKADEKIYWMFAHWN